MIFVIGKFKKDVFTTNQVACPLQIRVTVSVGFTLSFHVAELLRQALLIGCVRVDWQFECRAEGYFL